MKSSPVSISAIATLAAVASFWCVSRRPSPTHPSVPATHAEGTKLLARLPVAFVPNLGQWEHPARFVARIGAMTVFLEEQGWTLTLLQRTAAKGTTRHELEQELSENACARGVAVQMTFAGASAPELAGEDQLPGRHNYFIGNDPSKWRSDVPLYRAVRYRDIHPGIDVRAREQDGHFEYDLVLQPGAELEPVEITVAGIERMHLDGDGALVLETRVGPVRMPVPLSWEEGPSGERNLVSCSYVVRGDDRLGFESTGRRPGWALVVDPGLVWSTLLGGTGDDQANALALDAQGAATVAGYTQSTDYPTTPGSFDTSYATLGDVFVTRLSPTGSSLVYSTFLGGGSGEDAYALALDAQGAATLAGVTASRDFPTTPGAFNTSLGDLIDAFVTRLSPMGSSLVYSTLFGGRGDERPYALALDAQGAATVAGRTNSTNFPTTPGAFGTSHNGVPINNDAFVTRFSPTASSLVYSTFLGGAGSDIAYALALDAQGVATVAGATQSANFPTTPGAFDTSYNGGDAFVTQLSPTGSSLIYSTFLGTGEARALVLDAQGAATVAGVAASGFPTTPDAFDPSYNGAGDAFVARLSPTGSRLDYSTFLGGSGADAAHALALDARGAATVAGSTLSTDFPTTPGAFDTSFNGRGGRAHGDAFVTRLSPTGSSLVYSTLLGGMVDEQVRALVLDAQGAATVAGPTDSANFPTTPGAFDTSFNGAPLVGDAFITRLDMLPAGVSAFGRSSAGCRGLLAISVTSMPRVGNVSFALTCGNAPPNTTGWLVLTGKRLPSAVMVLGVEVWGDFSPPFVPLPASSNSIGATKVLLPIPNDLALANVQLFAQFFWAGPTAPLPCPPLGVSASNALDITIQR